MFKNWQGNWVKLRKIVGKLQNIFKKCKKEVKRNQNGQKAVTNSKKIKKVMGHCYAVIYAIVHFQKCVCVTIHKMGT